MTRVVLGGDGRAEIWALAAGVAGLLAVGYASTFDSAPSPTEREAILADLLPNELRSIRFVTETQTVSVARQKLDAGPPRWVLEVASEAQRHRFLGNDETRALLNALTPFKALRRLGSDMTDDELRAVEMLPPRNKLTLETSGGLRTFEVGGRSFGPNDWYVRPAGAQDVYLVASKVLDGLTYAETMYMERRLFKLRLTDVSSVTISSGREEKRLLHQNRSVESGAFWVDETAPLTRNIGIDSYIRRLEAIGATAYLEADAVKDVTPIFEYVWFDGGKPIGRWAFYKSEAVQRYQAPLRKPVLRKPEPPSGPSLLGPGDHEHEGPGEEHGDDHPADQGDEQPEATGPTYIFVTDATIFPVEVPASTGLQIEQETAAFFDR